MKTLFKFNLMLALCATLMISSCRRNAVEVDDNDTIAANDNSFAEASFNDVVTMADQAGDDGSLTTYGSTPSEGSLLSSCATITNDTKVNPHVLTIDFGEINCLCKDGKYRRGKVIVSYAGKYRDSASMHSVSFDRYYVNDYKIDGLKTVTNMGHNAAGHLVYSINVTGTITDTSGKTLTWNSTRNREWTEGESTKLLWVDDVYSFTGSSSGKSFNGTTFSARITSPVIVALSCRWIKQGTIEFTPGESATRVLDFGNGTCDALATVTLNGKVYNITMR